MKKADKVKKIITICSLTVFLVLGCVCAVCMALTGGMTFSLIDISAYQAQNGMMITHWAMMLRCCRSLTGEK